MLKMYLSLFIKICLTFFKKYVLYFIRVPEDQQSMFLPDITEEEETDTIHQRTTPKSSFSNLFSNASTGSDSAGIWR